MTATDEIPFPDPKERTPTILVVDDEHLLRMTISDFLQECGFKVLEASSGDEAIAVLENSKSPIDLVFSDVMMPGNTDGFALAKWVRANRPGVAVLLTSGDSKKAEEAHQLCEDGPFSAKPYDMHTVVELIRQTITKRKQD